MAARDSAAARTLRARPSPSAGAGPPLPPDSIEALAAALAPHLAQQLVDPAAPQVEGALLNAEQAAALLSVPATWVLAEARASRIPHVRLGRYVRFDAHALERWWQGRARGPTGGRT